MCSELDTSAIFSIRGQSFEEQLAILMASKFNSFIKSTDDAYKILEISPDSTDLEVKKAYRDMAKKYHPDKIQSNDEALKKGAKEKFQRVQDAYEKIQKERGF